MIIIHAYFKADPNKRDAFLEQAKLVAASSKAEEGNISYSFLESPEGTGEFVFVEKWKDQKAVLHHEETTAFKVFVSQLPNYLLEPLNVEFFDAEAIKK
ncbi:putative quinol monooxygenase [Paenibacillus sp. BSR1-1]|uniref:putative quinol monooxygenase n=1 Tax=Paenibacillus sp. BSR1-1 TaxID=3020845 RepID=UPI0025B1B774|nr:putative quinol monooxygenase [Paenibacillus sp. BSR1-1]MDN3019408.1 putative quinol monooxygenase [Paenibacillus sp. BSR1-1]